MENKGLAQLHHILNPAIRHTTQEKKLKLAEWAYKNMMWRMVLAMREHRSVWDKYKEPYEFKPVVGPLRFKIYEQAVSRVKREDA